MRKSPADGREANEDMRKSPADGLEATENLTLFNSADKNEELDIVLCW